MSIVKVIPLGGAGEIGKNCTVLETEDDLIVIDCGLSFPHEEHHGVDIVVPDFAYLHENVKRLRGVFITHAHEDHVGALAFFCREFKIPIYCTAFAEAMVRSKLEERIKLLDVDIRPLRTGKQVEVGSLTVEPIHVTHSIPESCALAIHTPLGVVLFTGDFKFDMAPVDGKLTDIQRLNELGDEGVLLLLSDSTNIDRPGWGPSESEVSHGLKDIFSKAPGRVLVTMFSSNIHRMQQVADAARATGRKFSICGRRMDQVAQIAMNLGYLRVPADQYVPIEEAREIPPEQIAILVTGSQAEENAALSQMSRGEYSRMQVFKGDTIIYSARPIPGNEGPIWRTINRLVELGAEVIHDYRLPVHSSGHAYQEEIKLMLRLTRPFYVAPVHGEPRHQKIFREMLAELGHSLHRVFTLSNGDELTIDDRQAWITGRVAWGERLIDQKANQVVNDTVLRQRSQLATDGVVVVSVVLNPRLGTFESKPEARVQGLVAEAEQIEDVLDDVVRSLGRMKPHEMKSANYVEGAIFEIVKHATWKHCRQRPVIVPVVSVV